MYKEMNLVDLKKQLKLPEDYKVDACIIYGSYDEKKYKRKFLHFLKNKKLEKEKLKHGFLEKILSIKVNNKRVWFIVEYGGTRLSEFIHFASMLGSKKNILLGSCGGLKKGLDEFSIIIPTYSYSKESSCHMYLRNNTDNKFYSEKDISREIIELLKDKQKIVTGPIVTCEAMMGETWEDILNWSKQGFYGVEMEASTVFAVSEHFKVPATAILRIADNLIEKETVGSESYEAKKKRFGLIVNDMFKTAILLSLENNAK